MVKVTGIEDCGNAPRKQILQKLNVAFAKNDDEFILDKMAKNIRWDRVGDTPIQGKDDFAKALKELGNFKTRELVINTVITHGDTGAVEGKLIMEDGSVIAFCDIYKFNGYSKTAKIKEMTYYAVELKSGKS